MVEKALACVNPFTNNKQNETTPSSPSLLNCVLQAHWLVDESAWSLCRTRSNTAPATLAREVVTLFTNSSQAVFSATSPRTRTHKYDRPLWCFAQAILLLPHTCQAVHVVHDLEEGLQMSKLLAVCDDIFVSLVVTGFGESLR